MLYLLSLYWEIREANESSSTASAVLSWSMVQIRTIPSEQAVTMSPFSKNFASQTQPGCSMLWTQIPSVTKHDFSGQHRGAWIMTPCLTVKQQLRNLINNICRERSTTWSSNKVTATTNKIRSSLMILDAEEQQGTISGNITHHIDTHRQQYLTLYK